MISYPSGKKAISMLVSALVCGMMLSGCGEKFPTLTQEEYDLIVDYSAGVLAKYSTSSGDKLTCLPPPEEPVPEEEQTDEPAAEDEEKPAPAPKVKEKAPEEKDTDEEPGGSDVTDEPAADDEEPSPETTEDDPPESADETADIGGGDDLFQKIQEGISVSFNGYYVLNKYPDNVTGSGTALKADPGNKLLILSFDLTNEKGEAVYADMLGADPMFTLMIDQRPVSKNLVTLLDNELSTFAAELEPGETRGVILCFNVTEEQAKQLDTVILRVNCRGEEQIIKLQ